MPRRQTTQTADIPRAFNSWVHPRRSSCTSSGATSVRCHASVQIGFGGAWSSITGAFGAFFVILLESLLRKTRVKKGILGGSQRGMAGGGS